MSEICSKLTINDVVNDVFLVFLLLMMYFWYFYLVFLVFRDGGRYHIETSPLICSANQWTGFYMITAAVMKGLKLSELQILLR